MDGMHPFLIIVIACSALQSVVAEVSYNRDVLPILSAKCFRCHGADSATRKAELRLDRAGEDGSEQVIVPGDVAASELLQRVFADDPELVMPPSSEKLRLDASEKRILKQWVQEGAEYQQHWAFLPPRKIDAPKTPWGNNEIDNFVYAKLKQSDLEPQVAAPKEQLIRRVSLDLTGLPPTVAEVDGFLNDSSDAAFERVVDQLLASQRYGERMATWWLDGAHYGDSHGYDNDLENTQWPWRSWVIDAFNVNKPFDEFTVEQLAGDMLPAPSEDQLLATAFNRNHRIQTEDGAIDEEWRTEYVIDRVETMGTVWMGLTLGCCRCHDHKYDPISQEEFYQLFALFNNLDEKGFINNLRGAAEPRVRYKAERFRSAASTVSQRFLNDEDQLQKAMSSLERQYPWVMVMREMEQPRATFVLTRGQYDAPGNLVVPGLPSVLHKARKGVSQGAVTRLTLARWLVNGRHPLTARVVVNRLWEQLFGTGIVESTENFGVQAEWPTHPELLDWLAVDFVESGWDVKALLKKIVLSATYRQSHVADTTRLRLDPRNRLLSRGPRVRLQSEMVRDQALFLAGLLHERIGGPSVRPYQPDGLWEEVEKRGTYQQDHGKDLYRRSLYTAVRKTVPTPEMALFDMPSREACAVRRSRTNTPLQALSLMNNVTQVEAARKLAEGMLSLERSVNDSIAVGFRMATQRWPASGELELLKAGFERRLKLFQSSPDLGAKLLNQGESDVSTKHESNRLAAMTTVASVLLNLDEVMHR